MKVIHSLGVLSLSKEVNEDSGFLLTNKKGGYCSFFGNPYSRYCGFFYFDTKTMEMYKFIESIDVIGHENADLLKNGFYFAERRKNGLFETFLMPKQYNSLIYELSSESEINLVLDCRKSFDNRSFGRYYYISEENGFLIVKFTKKTDAREDKTHNAEEFSLYLAVKSNNDYYQKNDQWTERHYDFDESRNSIPFRRHVYNALKLKGNKFVFSISKNKSAAMKECEYLFNNSNEIRNNEKEEFMKLFENNSVKKILASNSASNEVKLAYINALNSLNKLYVEDKNTLGLFAGLPWFFQFWSRDTLVSLKALSKINKKLGEKTLFGYLKQIKEDGRLQNVVGYPSPKNIGSADSVGWLFIRYKDFVENINNNKQLVNSIKRSISLIKQNKHHNETGIKDYIKRCDSIISKREEQYHKLLYEIESSLEKSLARLLKFHTKDNLDFNEKLETWMDTEYNNDARSGARIEIQAFRLAMYHLLFELTQNHKYKILENTLKNKLKHKFWNGKVLADGLNDFTIRPNLFLASYAYPQLFHNREWETCFENALAELWLEWGGLSTVDKSNELFVPYDTGENPKSYHRGNSWFWLNNLVAIQLNKINPKKFRNQIQKILEASTEDILWKGYIGCASETSPAKELLSRGCFNQAWSNAMYVEMIDEIYH